MATPQQAQGDQASVWMRGGVVKPRPGGDNGTGKTKKLTSEIRCKWNPKNIAFTAECYSKRSFPHRKFCWNMSAADSLLVKTGRKRAACVLLTDPSDASLHYRRSLVKPVSFLHNSEF